MTDIRREANDAAQKAFRAMLDHRIDTGQWDARLEREYLDAEQMLRDIESGDHMPEYVLDALHEALCDEIAELAENDPEWLPDVPLAAWTRIEDVPAALDTYWNRGA